jgi:hypothetical protein
MTLILSLEESKNSNNNSMIKKSPFNQDRIEELSLLYNKSGN